MEKKRDHHCSPITSSWSSQYRQQRDSQSEKEESNEIKPLVEKLNQSLIALRKQIDDLGSTMHSDVERLKEHCSRLRNEIDLSTESLIIELNKLNSRMMTRVDEYEAERMLAYKNEESKQKERISGQLVTAEAFYKRTVEKIANGAVVTADDARELLHCSTVFIEEVKLNQLNLMDTLFGSNILKFKQCDSVDDTVLGHFSTASAWYPSFEELNVIQLRDKIDNFKSIKDVKYVAEDYLLVGYVGKCSSYLNVAKLSIKENLKLIGNYNIGDSCEVATLAVLGNKQKAGLVVVYVEYRLEPNEMMGMYSDLYDPEYGDFDDNYELNSIENKLILLNADLSRVVAESYLDFVPIAVTGSDSSVVCLNSNFIINLLNDKLKITRKIDLKQIEALRPLVNSGEELEIVYMAGQRLYAFSGKSMAIISDQEAPRMRTIVSHLPYSVEFNGTHFALIGKNRDAATEPANHSQMYFYDTYGLEKFNFPLENFLGHRRFAFKNKEEMFFFNDYSGKNIYSNLKIA
jgi:hypothetical protein